LSRDTGRIVIEVGSVSGEQTYAEKWNILAHQVKLGRAVMEDKVKPSRPPLRDIDRGILASLSHEPVVAVRSIA
jgi:hypothetical protein